MSFSFSTAVHRLNCCSYTEEVEPSELLRIFATMDGVRQRLEAAVGPVLDRRNAGALDATATSSSASAAGAGGARGKKRPAAAAFSDENKRQAAHEAENIRSLEDCRSVGLSR